MAVQIILKTGQSFQIGAGAKVESGNFLTTQLTPRGHSDALIVKGANDQIVGMFRSSEVAGYTII